MSNQTTRTAIHEAGHVVAHVVLDLAIDTDTVTIVADDDSLGHATSPNPTFGYASTDKRDRERCRRDAIVALFAGRAAEHVLCGEPFTFDEESGSESDYVTAWQEMLKCHVRFCSVVGDDNTMRRSSGCNGKRSNWCGVIRRPFSESRRRSPFARRSPPQKFVR